MLAIAVPIWLYALLCVVLPAVWGLVMYAAFGFVERRRVKDHTRNEPPPIDYSI